MKRREIRIEVQDVPVLPWATGVDENGYPFSPEDDLTSYAELTKNRTDIPNSKTIRMTYFEGGVPKLTTSFVSAVVMESHPKQMGWAVRKWIEQSLDVITSHLLGVS